jgi:hypothetical protein
MKKSHDDKRTATSWLLLLLPFKKTSGENISAANMKKALAKSLPNSIRKGLDCLPRTGFFGGTTHQIHIGHLCPGVPGTERHQNDPPPATFARSHPGGIFFLFLGSEIGAGWPLVVPRQLFFSRQAEGGLFETMPKTSLLMPCSGVYGPLRK